MFPQNNMKKTKGFKWTGWVKSQSCKIKRSHCLGWNFGYPYIYEWDEVNGKKVKCTCKKEPELFEGDGCRHAGNTDFSSRDVDGKRIDHHYCPDCRAHWFRGQEYSREEWERKTCDSVTG